MGIRDWFAVSAHFRRGGPMKHKNTERGGARNESRDLIAAAILEKGESSDVDAELEKHGFYRHLCSWCGEKFGRTVMPNSHGICPGCLSTYFEEEDYVPEPAIIVDEPDHDLWKELDARDEEERNERMTDEILEDLSVPWGRATFDPEDF